MAELNDQELVRREKLKKLEQNEQEKNLSYISITRAMDKLYLVKEHDN